MEKQGTRGRFRGLASKLKSRKATSPATSQTTAATSSQNNQSQACQPLNNNYDDRQRAQIRYKEAATELNEAIKIRKGLWGSFDLEELSGEPEGLDDAQFKNKINETLISRETSIKDRKGWSKFTYAVECVFTALSPFAKSFLQVANNAQSVNAIQTCLIFILMIVQIPVLNPYGLICGGLLLLITVALFLSFRVSDSRLRIKRLRERRKLRRPWITSVSNSGSSMLQPCSLTMLNDVTL